MRDAARESIRRTARRKALGGKAGRSSGLKFYRKFKHVPEEWEKTFLQTFPS